MMSEILSNKEIAHVVHNIDCTEVRPFDIEFARAIEAAVLTKLRSQKPRSYLYKHLYYDGSFDWSHRPTLNNMPASESIPLFEHPAPIPEGYQLVPIEPTEKMMWALYGHWVGQLTHLDYERYKAMLVAARSE